VRLGVVTGGVGVTMEGGVAMMRVEVWVEVEGMEGIAVGGGGRE